MGEGCANGTVRGEVKFFNDEKGFGFITPDDNSQERRDIFVHHTSIHGQGAGFRTLQSGDRVQVEYTVESRGPKALNVKVE